MASPPSDATGTKAPGRTRFRICGWLMTYDSKRLDSGFASVRTNSVPTLNTSAAIVSAAAAQRDAHSQCSTVLLALIRPALRFCTD